MKALYTVAFDHGEYNNIPEHQLHLTINNIGLNYPEDKIEVIIERKNCPTPINYGDVVWQPVYVSAVQSIESAFNNGFMEKDSEHYIWEDVMVAIYGKDIFKRLGKLDG